MPYVESVKRWVNGALQQHIYWEYNTVFSDHSGAATLHPLTPSFRTTSSDADVSATITTMESLLSVTGAGGASAGGWNMITDNTTYAEPPNLFTEGGITAPGAKEIQDAEDANRMAHGTLALPFALLISYGLGLLAYGATHKAKMGIRGSLAVAIFVTALATVYFMKVSVLPGWTLIPLGLIGILLLMWKNPYNPATN
jgi:hypothetical protein